jgi:hypothetical protein
MPSVLEDGQAVAFDVLVELDSGRRASEQLFEPRLAHVQPPTTPY